ncbi:peptidase M23B [Gottschalkia purinilytica]|uniref:Peptidase M23B n=1 Tax=Gottschalkia purinilytica TaxID=1503 RepID=A0A0L0W6B4_GOTPU|nr:M23 family metallopeptidase [Gottschalkia purinilytica]KNF07021.1 peptidase M23B [Gottschalkia purinilytica]
MKSSILKKNDISKFNKDEVSSTCSRRLRKLYLKENKISILLILITVISIIAVIQYKKYEISTRAFGVMLGGKKIGVIRDKKYLNELVADLEEELSENHNKKISIDKNFMFLSTNVRDKDLTPVDSIKKNIKNNLTTGVIGYAIKINDKDIVYLSSKKLADEALNKIKEPYVGPIEGQVSNIKNVKLLENVKVEEKNIPIKKFSDLDTALNKLKYGKKEVKKHIVQTGESYWTIAKNYGLKLKELEEANPDKDHLKIRPGEEINISTYKPLVTVVTEEEVNYTEDIPFETIYETDDSLYKNKEKVKIEGTPGKVEKTSKIEKYNGVEVSKEVIKENVLSEPVSRIIVKGTKELSGIGTGEFVTPTRGTITSRFGSRWGKHHQGIDIGARIGTPIVAADSGEVVFSGWNNGGYGYMVEINHSNGYSTKYAHCSKLYVKAGDKVEKGDNIAAVGNTGRSTGPHLHFEVIKNGVHQNPDGYLD